MKQLIIILFILAGQQASAQDMNYTVEGKAAKQNENKKVVLAYRSKRVIYSDTMTIKKGKFTFTGKVDEPIKANLSLVHSVNEYNQPSLDNTTVYLNEGVIKIKVKDSILTSDMSGNKLNDDYQKYLSFLSPAEKKIRAVEAKWQALNKEEKEKFSYERMYIRRNANEEMRELMLEFARKYPESFFSLQAISDLSRQNVDVPLVKPIYDNFSDELKQTDLGQDLYARIEKASTILVGALAPDFEQNDVNDNPVKLSDFRGKYVLLDFWASWCGPCRVENPNLVKAYEKYKDRNFTILGVSLDNPGQKEAWLKAIEKDGLPWRQVSDLQGWSNKVAKLYSISAVPQSFIIDPEGKIIARRLTGERLHEFLEGVLPKPAP